MLFGTHPEDARVDPDHVAIDRGNERANFALSLKCGPFRGRRSPCAVDFPGKSVCPFLTGDQLIGAFGGVGLVDQGGKLAVAGIFFVFVGQDANFVRIALQGRASGRDAFGAVVRVETSAGTLTKVKSGGSGFLAQHDPRLLFGLGDDTHTGRVEIIWPSGARQTLANLPAGTSTLVVESGTTTNLLDEARFSLVDPLAPEDAMLAKLTLARNQPVPDLGLESAVGESDSLHGVLRPGRRTLFNFWATWCIPCRTEMPELQSLAPRLDAVGIDLIGLSIDTFTSVIAKIA